MRFAAAEKLRERFEGGVWKKVNNPYFKDLELLVVPGPSMATVSRIQELNTAYRKKNSIKEGREIPVEDAIRIAMRAHCGRKLKAWRGLVDDETGEAPEFTEANFLAVCLQFNLWTEITRIINEDEADEVEAQESLRDFS